MKCNSQASPTSYATFCEYEAYIQSIDEVENRIVDDSKFPVLKDNNKIKICCKTTLELTKALINYLKYNIKYVSEKTQSKTQNKDE